MILHPTDASTFRIAQERLLNLLRGRMRNGEITERALARYLGVSQSHINNVLRGRRSLSPNLADALLSFLHYSLLDLHPEDEVAKHLKALAFTTASAEVDVLGARIGPGQAWSAAKVPELRYRFPSAINPVPATAVLARLANDPAMSNLLGGRDIALIDTSKVARLAESPLSVFVVSIGAQARLRWIRSGSGVLYLVTEATFNQPLTWHSIPLREDQRLEVVQGRVIWLGRERSLAVAESA